MSAVGEQADRLVADSGSKRDARRRLQDRANSPNPILTMILSSWVPVVILLAPPGGGAFVPVPEDDSEDLDMPYDPGNDDGGHPPGGGPLGPGPGFGPSPDEPPVQTEYLDEAPPPGGPPGAPGAVPQKFPDQVLSPPMPWPAPATPIVPVPIPPHPQFPLPQSLRPPSPRNVAPTPARGAHPDDVSKAKARAVHPVGPPVVLLPGQSAGKKDPLREGDFPVSDEPASSSSSGPVAAPGLPVEFPIQQTPLPEPTQAPPVPDDDGDSDDTDATVDYRELLVTKMF